MLIVLEERELAFVKGWGRIGMTDKLLLIADVHQSHLLANSYRLKVIMLNDTIKIHYL